jgi:hypothetical protein
VPHTVSPASRLGLAQAAGSVGLQDSACLCQAGADEAESELLEVMPGGSRDVP